MRSEAHWKVVVYPPSVGLNFEVKCYALIESFDLSNYSKTVFVFLVCLLRVLVFSLRGKECDILGVGFLPSARWTIQQQQTVYCGGLKGDSS